MAISKKEHLHTAQIADIFRLNESERAIFDLLHASDYSVERYAVSDIRRDHAPSNKYGKRVSEISTLLKLPRMTCHDAIQSLIQRHFIVEKKIGRFTYYSLVDVDSIIDMVRTLFSKKEVVSLGRRDAPEEISANMQNEIMVYSGLENCRMIWRRIADLKRGQKFICVQPNASLRATFDKLGVDALYPNNDALNTKGIIVEGLVHNDCYEEIFSILKKHKGFEFALRELEKIAYRPAGVSLIDNEYLKQPTEMLFMNHVAYLINWQDEVAIEIHNKTMYDFMYEFYKLAQGYGKKINHVEHVKRLVERLKQDKKWV